MMLRHQGLVALAWGTSATARAALSPWRRKKGEKEKVMRRLTYLTVLALLAMLIFVPSAGAQQNQTVYIQDFYFSPASINIEPGTTVTWVNQGQAPHTATHTGGTFDSGTLQPGQSYSYTFNRAGTYAYYCQIHPNMTGTIVVGGGGAAYFAGSATASPTASPTATASALVATGGAPVVPAITLAASLALVVSGLAALRFVLRRSPS
jgi:plastocyanin